VALTVWSSVFLAFVSSYFNDSAFFYLGGQHGYDVAEWLIGNIGVIGLILVLLVVFILIAILLSNRIVPAMQSVFTVGKLKRKTDKTVPEEDDSEDFTIETYSDDDDDNDNDDGEDDEESDNAYIEEEKKTAPIQPAENKGFIIEVPKGEEDTYDFSELGAYDPRLDLSSYKFPDVNLLRKYETPDKQVDMDEQNENQKRITKTLEDFGINIVSIKATVGPTITLYEVVPDKGVRIAKIRNLEDDIALSLSALGIRIIAPMPGKGTIGIEVPNKNPQIVSMESVISSRKFVESKYELPIVLGRTITNEVFMFDLTKTPHLLVAGATGQGKSVGLNAIITSLLYKKHPAELKFVLVDPKMVEFNIYEEIEYHYLAKLPDMDKAIITDFTKVIDTLKSLCKEMDDRYELLTKAKVRNISEYNEKFKNRHLNPEKGHKFLPYIVVVIDEFGDLIMTAGKEIEMPIARIAQKARAVGIHMIIATQRPTTNIITGTIKANFPARMAFKVSAMIDSRTILDSAGANKLVGRGDLLYSQGNDMTRVQCALVNTDEIEKIVESINGQIGFETAYDLPEALGDGQGGGDGGVNLSDKDPLFEDAARLVVIQQSGSTSLIQRKFSIGYNRAGRLMDQLEVAGIVSAIDGSKGRQVLIQDEYSLEKILNRLQHN
ncbi:MAG: DNA translocase FtsK, partial [Tannerella sp.]|jgi:S-DNA-T family DNA segregation ATPase FtsK/SpoIIIE|nr:DNA translocase FtsK [Tannerella sp.]